MAKIYRTRHLKRRRSALLFESAALGLTDMTPALTWTNRRVMPDDAGGVCRLSFLRAELVPEGERAESIHIELTREEARVVAEWLARFKDKIGGIDNGGKVEGPGPVGAGVVRGNDSGVGVASGNDGSNGVEKGR